LTLTAFFIISIARSLWEAKSCR